MQKLLASVLSVSLIFGSVTPSLAQSQLVKGAARAFIPEAAGKSLSTVPLNKVLPNIGVASNLSLLQSEKIFQEISSQLQTQTALQQKTFEEIQQLISLKELTPKDAAAIYSQIFKGANSKETQAGLLYDVFPEMVVVRRLPVGVEEASFATDFYRKSLLSYIQNSGSLPSSFTEGLGNFSSKVLKQWSESMAAVTDLGFFGKPKDSVLLLEVYDKTPTVLKPVTEVVVGRALLGLGAYGAIEQLAQKAAVEGELSGEFWSGLESYSKEAGLNISLPRVKSAAPLKAPNGFKRLLASQNKLNVRHLDASAKATADWMALNLNKGRIIAKPVREQAAEVQRTAPMELMPASDLTLSLDNIKDINLLAGSLSFYPGQVGGNVVAEGKLPSENAGLEEVEEDPSDIISRVNSRYINVSYTKEVSQALQNGFEKAERKFIQEYVKTPLLTDPVFQKMWLESTRPELQKQAAKNRKLNEKVQQDVMTTLESSFDASYVAAPIESSSVFSRIAQYFRNKADRAAAIKASRAAQEASIKELEITYPAALESAPGVFVPQDYDIKFVFDSDSTKKAFLNVAKLDSETFVIDSNGSLLLRSPSGAVRGMMGVQIEGGNAATKEIFRILSARNLSPRFSEALEQGEDAVLELLTELRAPLNTILSKSLLGKQEELRQFLIAKDLNSAKRAFQRSGKIMTSAQALSEELKMLVANNEGKNEIVFNMFTDKAGEIALKLTAFSEGLSSFGQALAAATKIFGNVSSFTANLPSSAGQFGPALAPFISGFQTKLGLKHMAYWGQGLAALGLGVSAASLALGALDLWTSTTAFAGMVSGILINGIAGNGIIKQTNAPIAKMVANDPVSASSSVADLNSWASAGGIYCYLFLPLVGAATSFLFGIETGLATLSAMFGVAATAPLAAAGLLKMSKIKNVKESAPAGKKNKFLKSIWKNMVGNLKFAFTGTQKQELEQLVNSKAVKLGVSPDQIKPTLPMKMKSFFNQYLVQMAGRVGLYHFGGMAFNSGPGTVLKEVCSTPEKAMLASFAAVYLTVFLGRKMGAKAMGKGLITDKALIGLSSLIAVAAGGLSILPGLDIYTRSGLWAISGLGFANLANQEQAMALNRPENAGKKEAVSMIYVLARLTGMATILYGMLSDQISSMAGLSVGEGAIYGLALPFLATLGATLWNKSLITKDLRKQFKIWTTKKPKSLTYSTLRTEVEAAVMNNPQLGGIIQGDIQITSKVIKKLGDGILTRYRVDLTSLEQMMIALNDKVALDLHRLDMARKLYSRLSENTKLATGNPLTYEQFRMEVEPIYNSVVKARATGKSEQNIEKLINSAVDGIMAKYPVEVSDIRVIETRLLDKTRVDRIRIATVKYLYGKQLTKEAETEITSQLKNMTPGMDKQAIVNHILEKYKVMGHARGITFNPPANAEL